MVINEHNPEKNYWMGASGFQFWVGQVQGNGSKKINADLSTSNGPIDETKSIRVKVRVVGYHSSKHEELPVEDLPWAQVMMPATLPQMNGHGSSHQLALGSWVIGFFFDGMNCQQPIVLGVIGDIANEKYKERRYLKDNQKNPGFNNILNPALPKANQTKNSPGWSVPSSIASPPSQNISQLNNSVEKKNLTEQLPDMPPPAQPGGLSPQDEKYIKSKEKTASVANGKCGTELKKSVSSILKDFFNFVKTVDKGGNFYFDKITKKVVNIENKIKSFVNRIKNSIFSAIGDIKTKIIDEIRKKIKELVMGIISPVQDSIKKAKESSDILLKLIVCLLDNLMSGIEDYLTNLLISLLENAINPAICLVNNFIQSIFDFINNILSGILESIQNVLSLISTGVGLISKLSSGIFSFFGSFCGIFDCGIGNDEYDFKAGDFFKEDSDDTLDIPDKNFSIIDNNGILIENIQCDISTTTNIPKSPQIIFNTSGTGTSIPIINPVIDNNGRIVTVIIDDAGSNLNNVSIVVRPTDNAGFGALLEPIIRDGKLKDVKIINSGIGFPVTPKDLIDTKFNDCNKLIIEEVKNSRLTSNLLITNTSIIPRALSIDTPNLVLGIVGFSVESVGFLYEDDTTIVVNDELKITPIIENSSIVGVIADDIKFDGSDDSFEKVITIINKTPKIEIISPTGYGAKIIPMIRVICPNDQLNTLNRTIEYIDCSGDVNVN